MDVIHYFLLVLLFEACAVQGWFRRNRRRACYQPWGCFEMREPFTNTGHLPESPSSLGVQFFLHTRGELSSDGSDSLTRVVSPMMSTEGVLQAFFDPSKDTRVIVHGYLESRNKHWVRRMVRSLLDRDDQNVVVLDWERGARSVNYLQVAANTRLVGKMLAAMLGKFTAAGAEPSSFHLIGFSLGAHVAGYAGSEVYGVGRITGLDPAGPSFKRTPPAVRLDPTDAMFVDVIHTNAEDFRKKGLGYKYPCGTVDFYPNGGRHQPGCTRSVAGYVMGLLRGHDFTRLMACHHMRAPDLFIESINNYCPMRARPIGYPTVLGFSGRGVTQQQQCTDCITMGYDVDTYASGVFYVRTRSEAPFCEQ